MQTLLSENEFSRLALRVAQKSNGVTPADVELLNHQIALRKQAEDQERERKHQERQARIQAANAEAAKLEPPKPIEKEEIQSTGWIPFISDNRVSILIKKNVHGSVYAFGARKKSGGQVLPLAQFETLQAGPIGNFLLCAAKVREMLT